MASAAVDSPLAHSPSQSRSFDSDQEQDDADLFGDEDAGDAPVSHRKLDDSELDSGDDIGRNDRLEDGAEDTQDFDDHHSYSTKKFLPKTIGRLRAPEADNEEVSCVQLANSDTRLTIAQLYLLNMPPFLGLQQKNFDPDTYKPPTESHDGGDPTKGKFSPFSVAASTIHWRRDPQDPRKLQSNSRIIRWSDGSLTLQIASSPKDQYRASTTALRQTFGKRNKPQAPGDYDPSRDANAYLSAPHTSSNLLQVIAPLSAAMRILPTGSQTDESVLRLQNSLAAAQASHDPFAAIKNIKEDPEMAKKAAEAAEKDIARQKRRKEAELERQYTRRDKVLGRGGLSRGVGLSVAGLEDEDGMPTTARPKKAKRKVNRRGDIYSDDEDEGYPRGRTKEDEYDLDDAFMAASDEEPEIYEDEDAPGEEDDPDVDDLEIEGREMVVQGKTRGEAGREREVTPKRIADDQAVPSTAGSPHAGRKKRRVIDDDDDDE
jgi:RNA polymerase-associated protein LEO1